MANTLAKLLIEESQKGSTPAQIVNKILNKEEYLTEYQSLIMKELEKIKQTRETLILWGSINQLIIKRKEVLENRKRFYRLFLKYGPPTLAACLIFIVWRIYG